MKDSSDTHPNHLPDSSYGLFIDNQWGSGEYGETLDIINPANGKILTNIPTPQLPTSPARCRAHSAPS